MKKSVKYKNDKIVEGAWGTYLLYKDIDKYGELCHQEGRDEMLSELQDKEALEYIDEQAYNGRLDINDAKEALDIQQAKFEKNNNRIIDEFKEQLGYEEHPITG